MISYKLKIGLLPIRRYIKEPPKRIGIFQSGGSDPAGRSAVFAPFVGI